jgi:NDP-sugar pyrophosphorylase family protein
VNRVVILAGGKGERLRPYTEDRPKPMVEVMGHPILLYLVRWLASHNLREITISCGHLHNVITDYFGDGSKYGCKIKYLIEDEPLGRGGALRHAIESHCDNDEPVLALNGDMITNLNVNALIEKHKSSDALGTVLTAPLVSPHGILDIDEQGRIYRFREKPQLPFWISAGIYVLEQELVERLPKQGDHELTTFPQLAEEGKLNSFKFDAFWRSIDTIKDLADIQNEADQAFFDNLVNVGDKSLLK